MPVTTCNTELIARLKAHQITPDTAPYAGIVKAIGVWPGDSAGDADTYPLLAFHVTTSIDPLNVTCYLVTPGRFARYEWTPEESMLFSCPVGRVRSVTESATAHQLTVKVELDAQAQITVAQAQTSLIPGGEAPLQGTVMEMRTESASYALTAVTPEDIGYLTRFGLALATALDG